MSASNIDQSRALASAAARPVPSRWSRTTGRALAVVSSDPSLWLLGIAGFLLRGGWIAMALPIWTLPSPVAVSTAIGADAYGAGGLSPGAVTAIVVALTVVGAFFLACLAGSAAVEVLAFERFMAGDQRGHEPDAGGAGETAATGSHKLRGEERLRLVIEVMRTHATFLIPAGAALVLTVLAVIRAGFEEYLLPGDLNVPLALRVAGAAQLPLLLLVLAVFLAEFLGGMRSRRLLAARLGVPGPRPRGAERARGGLRPRGEEPLAALRTAAACWLLSAGVLAPGLAVTLVAWGAVRTVFLSSSPAPAHDFAGLLARGFVTLALVATWTAVLVLAGVAGALRAALWTARALPERAVSEGA